jgi:hypothetical protein
MIVLESDPATDPSLVTDATAPPATTAEGTAAQE